MWNLKKNICGNNSTAKKIDVVLLEIDLQPEMNLQPSRDGDVIVAHGANRGNETKQKRNR
jgi:hypothetical protein